jgi:beta-glucosidase
MKRIFSWACLLISLWSLSSVRAQDTPSPKPDETLPFRDPSLPIPQRVADLISRMTLEEKCGMVIMKTPGIPRLGIPAYEWWSECLHGVARAGKATSFPQAIGLAATWNTGLMRAVAEAISDEGRAKHKNGQPSPRYYGLTFWSPTINMARDPRWGRTEETYGEDPLLTGEMAVAFVRGLQGDHPDYFKLVATVKHFAANNEENVRHTTRPAIAERTLREYYLPQFRRAIVQGRVASIMTTYNGLNDIPNSANKWLLQDVLRRDWGFTGAVVTDVGAVADIWKTHKKAADMGEAIAMCLNAGCDVLDEQKFPEFQDMVIAAWRKGLFTQTILNRALTNNLTVRFQLGMFDPDAMVPYTKIPESVVESPEHVALAREAARQGIVLLKNDRATLPLNPRKLQSIAVLGPYADHVWLGGYSGTPSQPPITVAAAIQAKVGDAVKVNTVPFPEDDDLKKDGAFDSALAAAKHSDLVVVALGLGRLYENEQHDKTTLNLPPEQQDFLEKVYAANKRVVLVLQAGSPVAIPWAKEHVPAILTMWYCGQEGGNGLADVLFGDANPAGRLPITFYASDDQLPPMGDYEVSHGRTYLYLKEKPLWAFGHGLSYSTFRYGKPVLSATKLSPSDRLQIVIPVKNAGKMAGDEVVQVYVRNEATSVPQPIHALKAFSRASIAGGQTTIVSLGFDVAGLAYWDDAKKGWLVAHGSYEVQIGSASDDIRQTAKIEVAEGDNLLPWR